MSKRQRQRQCNRNNLGLSEVEVGGNLRSFWQSQVLGLLKPRTAELIEPTPTKKSRNRSERQNKRGCQHKWHTWPPSAGSAWLNKLYGRCAPAKCILQIFAPDFSFFNLLSIVHARRLFTWLLSRQRLLWEKGIVT